MDAKARMAGIVGSAAPAAAAVPATVPFKCTQCGAADAVYRVSVDRIETGRRVAVARLCGGCIKLSGLAALTTTSLPPTAA